MVDISWTVLEPALRAIEGGYVAGRDALLKQAQEAEDELLRHTAALASGSVDDDILDEVSGSSWGLRDLLIGRTEACRTMVNRHAQAFTLLVHHAWEKHALMLDPALKRYAADRAYENLAKVGLPIDEPRLERLRLAANFIKHESSKIFDAHPGMFVGEFYQIGDRQIFDDDNLLITNHDVMDFLDAVRTSAGVP